jgi:hypothetical protein
MNIALLDKRIRNTVYDAYKVQKKGFHTFDPYRGDTVLYYLELMAILRGIIEDEINDNIEYGINLSFMGTSEGNILEYNVNSEDNEDHDLSKEEEMEFLRKDLVEHWQKTGGSKRIDHMFIVISVNNFSSQGILMDFLIYPDCFIGNG